MSTDKIHNELQTPKIRKQSDNGNRQEVSYERTGGLGVIPELGVSNFPDHLPPEVRHVGLGEAEVFFTARKRLQELAGEHTTVKAVLLLWRILETVVLTQFTEETVRLTPTGST